MNRVKENKKLRWTEAHARRELEAWRRSGDSMAAYTRERGYSAQRLSWWKGRLEAEERPVETTMMALAPAVITGVGRPPVVVSVAADEVRVEIDDPSAVHPAWLAELASMLRRGALA